VNLNPVDKLKRVAIGKLTALVLKSMDAGTFPLVPKQAKWLYDHLDGLHTWTGAILWSLVGAVEAAQTHGLCDLIASVWPTLSCAVGMDYLQYAIASLGTVFLYIGQVNGGIKTDRPGMVSVNVAPSRVTR
jgi:hypothetical protein